VNEIYVRTFPDVSRGRWRVSTDRGTRPAWSRSGRELFYLDRNDMLTSVTVEAKGSTFSAGNPTKLLDSAYFTGNPQRTYDVTADGQKFLMIKDVASGDRSSAIASIDVVLNWTEELKTRVPAKQRSARGVETRRKRNHEDTMARKRTKVFFFVSSCLRGYVV